MLAIAAIGLGVNAVGIVLLRSGSTESLNLKGAYFEVLSDTLSSVGVIAAAAVMWTTGWRYADPLVSAGIGLFILPRTWILLRQAVGVLLEGTPADVDLEALRDALGAIDGVTDVHDLHVWALTSGVNAMSVHVVARGADDHGAMLNRVGACANGKFRIAHVTVQVEPPGWTCGDTYV
jgi:cobalt-zinc-cadmium efflux system protein